MPNRQSDRQTEKCSRSWKGAEKSGCGQWQADQVIVGRTVTEQARLGNIGKTPAQA